MRSRLPIPGFFLLLDHDLAMSGGGGIGGGGAAGANVDLFHQSITSYNNRIAAVRRTLAAVP